MTKETLRFFEHEVEVWREPRRRRLVLTMHPDRPLRVRTNRGTAPDEILKFLLAKKDWIEKNTEKFRALEQRFPRPRMREGEIFPFCGEFKYLQFVPGSGKRFSLRIEDGFLICTRPEEFAGPEAEKDFFTALKAFYKREAQAFLTARLEFWASETGLRPRRLIFRANQTRWGSCTSAGHISLNWKLICQAPALMDYVIVHELCHLRHLNHSADFWNLVESYLPSYREVEEVLDDQERLGAFLA